MKIRDQIAGLEDLAENTEQSSAKVPPIAELIRFWPIIRAALTIVKVFTGPKADAKINEIITWGDLLNITGNIGK